ncbi:S-adenosylmethionine:tRNA ribosyltransferase-isomerase [Bacillus sinesaloumensis]|uniref:S-adenosylmethionine:tRNA ribosyltransferase-isomerase n=1 Tax=Litchfieldia sinesaloumensis TaxID=1926280 RepID=UPI000988457D|nr:S-adenosylmethionine:tRNA ribosyltransferase-isomerase [Bacillus sinesaloumensis]
MATNTFDYNLPTELNASVPPEKRGIRRDHVRMMVLNRYTGSIQHSHFFQLPDYLQPGDLVVLNNSRTIPAVLHAKLLRVNSQTETNIEVRLARRCEADVWEALIDKTGVDSGDTILFSHELSATVIGIKANSPLKVLRFSKKGTDLLNIIYSIGEPVRYEYIDEPWELDYYQTVFASHPGSVEMPSAGRAFTWELLFTLMKKGIKVEFIQLHTGLSYLLDDQWHHGPEENEENYYISRETMKKIQKTKAAGNKVIAVGTTVVRALESATLSGTLSGTTKLYINHRFPLQIADGIITGFHEPEASHLDMLSAFISEQHLLKAYHQAIEHNYLWHEFGDMNLII